MNKKASKMVQQVLRSSHRVAEARKMIGLKKDEYLVGFGQGQIEIGNYKNKKIRIVKQINGQSASMFLVSEVIPYIQKEIIGYFGIPVNGLVCILMDKPRFQGFSFQSDGITRTIKIQFAEKLNSKKLQNLFKKIETFNQLWFDKGCHYEKAKPIKFFDRKFLILKEYQALRAEYPTKIPETLLNDLIEKTKNLLNITKIYVADDFRKTISEFKKNLYG